MTQPAGKSEETTDLILSDLIDQIRLFKDILLATTATDATQQMLHQALKLICTATGWEYGRGFTYERDHPERQIGIVEWPSSENESHPSLDSQPTYSLPISVNGTTGALLEFYSSSNLKPEANLQNLLAETGSLLGNIIERQQSVDQLREKEEQLRLLVESVTDYAFYTLDLDGCITSWNRGAEKIKGYHELEIIGKSFKVFYTEQAIAENKPYKALEIARQEGRFDEEDWRMRKDGTLFWANVVIFPIYNSSGSLQGYSKLTRDLTKRKLIEAELQESQARFQIETAELRRRLMDGREAERLHMAQELHDGPIQDLYGLIFGLDAVRTRIRSQPVLLQINEMKSHLQQVVSTLRGIIGDLRPPTLAPFGLEKAIRSHLQNFREAHPELQIELDLDSDRRMLLEDTRLALFRVYQSSLANIVRHAEASRVKIILKLEEEQVWLEISDNGKGFIVPERWIKLVRAGNLGLVGARERTEAIGGTFLVQSNPGEGTQVKVIIPRSALDVGSENESGR